jgi:hypothetical protein
MSIQNTLDARDDRYLKLVLGRMYGQTDDEIVQPLEDFDSPQDLYQRISEDGHPICPRCGTTYVDETHCEAQTGKRGQKKSTPPRLRNVGPRKDLPPAGNAAELFKERLEALLKIVELLQHVDESLYGKYFGRTYVETASVLRGSSWTDDEVVSLPDTVALTPSEIEATLIGVYALAGGQMDLLLEALHPDGLSASAGTREEIRQYVEGSRADGEKRDGLKVLAPNLAAWVRGGGTRQGRRPELSEMDHAVASITSKYRKEGLTDEEITRKLAHLKKEDGTRYTIKDVTDLGDLGLSWS